MSDPSAATAEVKESDKNLRGEKVEREKRETGNFFQNIISSWQDSLKPPDDVTTALAVWKRILAGGFGALSVQSAVAISQIPIPMPVVALNNLSTLSGAELPALIVLYWILISGILFSGYTRRADFVHVLRASILFNLLIVGISSLSHLGFFAKVAASAAMG